MFMARDGASGYQPPDPYFSNTVFLLKTVNISGVGTLAFRDKSTNNSVLTRAGDATQGTFSPYIPTGFWSVALSGSNYLGMSGGTPLTFGTGDFTIECWISVAATGAGLGIMDFRPTSTNGAYPDFYYNGTSISWYTNTADQIVGTATIPANVWTHVAACRASGVTRLFVNGVQTGSSYTDANNYLCGASRPFIAGHGFSNNATSAFNGSISNLRVLKGTALYTGTFTPPTGPLTAITNTSLLCLQDNTFKDNSTNALAITGTSSPAVSRFSPFTTVTPVNQSLGDAGSVSFNGTNSYLSIPTGYLPSIGTGDFTVEGWWYFIDFTNRTTYNQRLWSFGTGLANDVTLAVGVGGALVYRNNDTALITAPSNLSLSTWYHVALVRSSGTTTLYVNGSSVGSTSTNNSLTTQSGSPFYIGVEGGGTNGFHYGNVSNVRMTNTAVYTGAFTPPTSPLSAISGTRLLTAQSASTITDASGVSTVTAAGSATAVELTPFDRQTYTYGGSAYFDGTGDYLQGPTSSSVFAPGTGDFSVEAWIYPTSTSVYRCILTTRGTAANSIFFGLNTGTLNPLYFTSVAVVTSSIAVPINAWSHVALVRKSGTATIYVNGVSGGSAADASNLTGTNCVIGGDTSGTPNSFVGYITGLRFIKGAVAYDTSFTPPASPVTATANTSLLVNFDQSGIYDATGNTTFYNAGNTKTSTAVTRYGQAPVVFDGVNGSYLRPNANVSANFALGTGDFTIEAWIYATTLTGFARLIYDARPLSTQGVYPVFYVRAADQALCWYVSSADRIVGSVLSTNTWYHVAVCRSNGSTRMFINGTQVGSTYTDTNNYLNGGADRPRIGGNANANDSNNFIGYLSDVRVTKGIARYTGAQPTPLAPLSVLPSGAPRPGPISV